MLTATNSLQHPAFWVDNVVFTQQKTSNLSINHIVKLKASFSFSSLVGTIVGFLIYDTFEFEFNFSVAIKQYVAPVSVDI